MAERLISAVTAAVLATTGTGLALSPTDAKAETDNQTKIVTEGSFPSEDALSQMGIKADAGVSDVTPTVDMSEPTGAPTPSKEDAEYTATIEVLKSLGFSPEYYIERQKKINKYKEELKANGGQEINLQACAEACVIIDEAVEREKNQAESLNDNPEALFLNHYFNKEQVFEFCRTGEIPEGADFKVVYFKDKNGERTNEPGQFFVFNPDGPVFDISAIEETFNSLDEDFSRCLAGNKVRVLLLTQLKRNGKDITSRTYDEGMIVFNFSSNKLSKFKDYLREGVAVEQYGSCALTLGMSVKESTLLKGEMAKLCCKYIVSEKANKTISKLISHYQSEGDTYLSGSGWTIDERNILVEKCKKIMVPFSAESWAKVDAANATAKNN